MTTNAAEPKAPFEDCTADHVFAEISAKLSTSELRGLWARLQDEIKRQGVGASATYLGGEFTRLKQEFARELSSQS
jgi:hypothetical protein